MNFEYSQKSKELQVKVDTFMKDHIYPIEKEFIKYSKENIWKHHPAFDKLKEEARLQGLWNLFLPKTYGELSPGLSNLEYAPLAELMGRVSWASEVFNCSAPDTGNMEVLAKYGTDDQKSKWLKHLMNGKIRSAFLMTANTPGVNIIRPLQVFGNLDSPEGHAEIELVNVRVPKENILLGEGRGFEIAQGRLGPGRIHHCMRLIGAAQRALELMCKRVAERETFGKQIMDYSSIRQDIAKSRCEIEQARLLTLSAADKIDRFGIKKAKELISMIKIVCPKMTCRVVDRAIQAYGGMGVCQDTPLAGFWLYGRIIRIADGPDEVHMYQLGRNTIKEYLKA